MNNFIADSTKVQYVQSVKFKNKKSQFFTSSMKNDSLERLYM